MPLMIEPLVFKPNVEAGGYQVDGDLEKILPLVRQAVELGADVMVTEFVSSEGIIRQDTRTRKYTEFTDEVLSRGSAVDAPANEQRAADKNSR